MYNFKAKCPPPVAYRVKGIHVSAFYHVVYHADDIPALKTREQM